ncbi:MAG TPA: BatD family protein [Gammaproteobacteria bacterium]|nr:BatD family protein [Gammaproteobacteria bacterium]
MRGWAKAAATALCAWLALASALAFAQEPAIQATVDRAVVRINESFTYVLRAEGAVRGEPEIAPLAAQFDILNTTSSRRIGVVNARASEVNEWQYQLMPKKAGDFTIPPLRIGDRQSNSVPVRVLEPDPNASAAADIFMELSAEPDVIYVQSQVLFTLRLFVGVSTGRATLTAPETTGVEAIVEKLGEDSQYQTSRGGRDFIVRERRYAVFPQQAGTLTVGPVTFEAMVIPDRGFSRVQRFRSDVLELTVQPAVAPPPALAGAAWLPAQSVKLTEQWSEPGDELAVGIPRTRTIGVEALGLLETQLPDVLLETQAGIRQYADRPELTREITADGLLSRRTVGYAVIAQTPGDVTLAGVHLPWFNVATQRWEVAELAPLPLRITPSTDAEAAEPAAAPAAAPSPVAARDRNPWPWISGVLALAWIATVALWWRNRGRAPRPVATKSPPAATPKPLRKILRDLESACAVNDPEAARQALLKLGETRFTDNPPRSLGALAALLPNGAAREVLALEAHIYGAAAGAWRGEGLKAALGELENAGTAPAPPAGDPLLPLYR